MMMILNASHITSSTISKIISSLSDFSCSRETF
jgi:hypothetical protein